MQTLAAGKICMHGHGDLMAKKGGIQLPLKKTGLPVKAILQGRNRKAK